MWKQSLAGIIALAIVAVSVSRADESGVPVTLSVAVDSPPAQHVAVNREATVKFRAVIDAGDVDRTEAIAKEADENKRFNWWVYVTPVNPDGTRGQPTTYPESGSYSGKPSRFTFAHTFTALGKYRVCASAELTGDHYAFSTSAEVEVIVVPVVIEADVVDEPAEDATYASGVNKESILLRLNNKAVTPTVTKIKNGYRVQYVPADGEVVEGSNTVSLRVRDLANAGAPAGTSKDDYGNETEPDPSTWTFTSK
jgi:hypothetical protein